jgi:hypothetical protein
MRTARTDILDLFIGIIGIIGISFIPISERPPTTDRLHGILGCLHRSARRCLYVADRLVEFKKSLRGPAAYLCSMFAQAGAPMPERITVGALRPLDATLNIETRRMSVR